MASGKFDDVEPIIGMILRRQFDDVDLIVGMILRRQFDSNNQINFLIEKINFEKPNGRVDFILEKRNFLKKHNRYIYKLKNVGVMMARKGIFGLRRAVCRFPAVYRFFVKIGAKRMYNSVKLKIKGEQKYE